MSSLFQINEHFLSVLDMCNDDVDPQLIQDTLDSIETELNEKVDNIINLKRTVDGDIDVIDKEIKRLQTMKKQKKNLSERLKSYLFDMLEQRNLQKYRTSKNNIFKRRNAPSLYIMNEELIDKSYFIEQEPKLDKKALKEDLKNGADVLGVELRDSESLVIK